MNGKQIWVIISLILILPILFSLLAWLQKVSNQPSTPENIAGGTDIIVEAAIPWRIGIFKGLAGLPVIIGAIPIIAFILFLKWVGEIK